MSSSLNTSRTSAMTMAPEAPRTTFVGALLPTFAMVTSSAIFMSGFFGNMWLVQMGLMGFGYWRPAIFFGLWQVCVKELCSVITEPTFFEGVPQSWRAVQAFETIGIIIIFISFFFHLMRWVTTYYRKVLYNLCHKLAFGTQIAAGVTIIIGSIAAVIVNNHFRDMYSDDAPLVLSVSFSMATLGGVLLVITGVLTTCLTPESADTSFRTMYTAVKPMITRKSKGDMSDEDRLQTSMPTFEA